MKVEASREEQFLSLVRDQVRASRDGREVWVDLIAGRVRDDAVVVLSQRVEHHGDEYTLHPIDGRRFILRRYGEAVHGDPDSDVRVLAADASRELQESHEAGVLLKVPWAEGLTGAPKAVQWHGDAIDQARRPDGR